MSVLLSLLLAIGLCIVDVPAWAAPPTTFVWDRNIETDVDHYNVYTCSTSAVCTPSVNIGTVIQPPVGPVPSFTIPNNTEGRAAVTAVDTLGNESGQSNVVAFDRKAPANPLNLRAQ